MSRQLFARAAARMCAGFALLAMFMSLGLPMPLAAVGAASNAPVQPAALSRRVLLPLVAKGEVAFLRTPGIELLVTPSEAPPRGPLTFYVVATNNRAEASSSVSVRIPFSQELLTDLSARPARAGRDSVSLSAGAFDVRFDTLAPGESVRTQITMLVGERVTEGQVISLRGTYACSERPEGCQTNQVRVTVNSNPPPTDPGSVRPLTFEPPQGPVGATFTTRITGFQPNEPINTWVELADNAGSYDAPLPQSVDANGEVVLALVADARFFQPGTHRLVVRGVRSKFKAAGTFVVQAAGTASARAELGRAQLGNAALPQLAASQAQLAQAQGFGGIKGRVTAADSGAGLADVLVLVRDAAGLLVQSAVTNANGDYIIFDGLVSGSYSVEFSTSFTADALTGSYTTGVRAAVVVNDPDLTLGVDAALTRAGSISGRVTGADSSAGLEDVGVLVFGSGNTLVAATSSDAAGNYSVDGLAAGTYRVVFAPQLTTLVTTRAYSGRELPAVVVNAPNASTGVDAVLDRLATYGQISGTVTAADSGQPLEDVLVLITGAEGQIVSLVETDAQGAFTSDPLSSGRYQIEFLARFSSIVTTSAYLDAALPELVEVVGAEVVTGAGIALTRGAQISGRVTAADSGLALEDVLVFVSNAQSFALASTTTDANGNYITPGLPADAYTVTFYPGYSAVPTTTNYIEADVGPLTVEAGAQVTNIDAALTQGGQIAGLVTAEDDGTPLEDVLVVVAGVSSNLFAYSVTDAQGGYAVTGLPAGNYTVEFDPDFSLAPATGGYLGEFYDNAANQATATAVTVTPPNATPNINAALAPGGIISGTITAEDSGTPLEAVLVEVRNATTGESDFALTGADGSYTIAGLPSGSYTVLFDTTIDLVDTTTPYVYEYYNNATDELSATAVLVQAPNGTPNIDAALARGAQISGRVTAADSGNGLFAVEVLVTFTNGTFGTRTFTDVDGNYSTAGLPSGSYTVLFEPTFSSDLLTRTYLSQYYNNKPDAASADPVVLTAPNPATNINALLARAAGR